MKKAKHPWKTHGSKTVHKNPWFHVKRDFVTTPSGKRGSYFIVDTKTVGVYIAAVNAGQIYLVRVARYITGKSSFELPAGSAERQKPLVAAKRELLEETGLTAKSWRKLGTFQAFVGRSNHTCYVFLAQGLKQGEYDEQKEEGILEAKAFPIKKILSMIEKNEIIDSESIAALNLVLLKLRYLRIVKPKGKIK
jgi:8-oxo-dGTP pyrophosphatase MutT (NUDIX family)